MISPDIEIIRNNHVANKNKRSVLSTDESINNKRFGEIKNTEGINK